MKQSNHTHIVVFSSYPRKNQTHDKNIVGGASYTKTLLTKLKEQFPEVAITVCAEKFDTDVILGNPQKDKGDSRIKDRSWTSQDDQDSYTEDRIRVKRMWKRNNIFSILKSVVQLSREQTNSAYISYEINMVGGTIANIFFLLSLISLKLSGKQLIFIPHQVVDYLAPVKGNNIFADILNFFKTILFQYILLLSNKIIVFEEYFKQILPNSKKAVTIPLAVAELKVQNKTNARKALGIGQNDFVMLFFGFLSPYKGLDELIDTYNTSMGKLILAGGGNPNHMNKPWYRKYVKNVQAKAEKKSIIATGFVPEHDIEKYYAAADVLLLPYKIFFSSSFPLSLAFSYEKPVLISKQLEPYFQSPDFQNALKNTGLDKTDIVVDFNKDIKSAINTVQKKKDQFIAFSKELKNQRNINMITEQFRNTI